jgi:hypothetical protein
VLIDGYFGVVGPLAPAYARPHRVHGVRLLAAAGAAEDGTPALSCPNGWEYLLVGTARGREWGWEREETLVAAGYAARRPQPQEAA